MATVAVTGATGFIGKHLVRRLRGAGYTVIVVDSDVLKIHGNIDRIYHLACPSSTAKIVADPTGVMDTILDYTRQAMHISPTALFVNVSTFGATDIDNTPQGAYNVAKRCMEVYVANSGRPYKNYRLPAVYGEGVSNDAYIKRCIDGTATFPEDPDKDYYIAHVDDIVHSMIELTPVVAEKITLGNIYEQFNSGRRGLYRPTPSRDITQK